MVNKRKILVEIKNLMRIKMIEKIEKRRRKIKKINILLLKKVKREKENILMKNWKVLMILIVMMLVKCQLNNKLKEKNKKNYEN